ncbi:MAG: hypothetical protein ACLTAX_17815 [Waltera sp.]
MEETEAGKSTLSILSQTSFADQGEVLIDGIPAKENIGCPRRFYRVKRIYMTEFEG